MFAKKKHREFVARTGVTKVDATVNALAHSAQFIRSRHKRTQASLTSALMFDPQMTPTKLAKKLRISKSAVSQTLKTAGFDALQEINIAITQQLPA